MKFFMFFLPSSEVATSGMVILNMEPVLNSWTTEKREADIKQATPTQAISNKDSNQQHCSIEYCFNTKVMGFMCRVHVHDKTYAVCQMHKCKNPMMWININLYRRRLLFSEPFLRSISSYISLSRRNGFDRPARGFLLAGTHGSVGNDNTGPVDRGLDCRGPDLIELCQNNEGLLVLMSEAPHCHDGRVPWLEQHSITERLPYDTSNYQQPLQQCWSQQTWTLYSSSCLATAILQISHVPLLNILTNLVNSTYYCCFEKHKMVRKKSSK